MRNPGRLVLLGHPVAHSLSPQIHNAALAAAGIPLEYEAWDVTPEDLANTAKRLVSEGAAGNVTIPHKLSFGELCDELTAFAEQAGAVNTWWVDGETLVGDNTDVLGASAAAQEVLGHSPVGERVAIIGSGGGAAGVLLAVSLWGQSSARVYGRNRARVQALCARFADVARAERVIGDAVRDATLVVNATPIGLHDSQLPVPLELLDLETAVLDLVYRRGGTAWVIAARERGHRAVDGLPMLLEQAALSFERWFAINADRAAMWGALADAV